MTQGYTGGLSITRLQGIFRLFLKNHFQKISRKLGVSIRPFICVPNHLLRFYKAPWWQLRFGSETAGGSQFFSEYARWEPFWSFSNWSSPPLNVLYCDVTAGWISAAMWFKMNHSLVSHNRRHAYIIICLWLHLMQMQYICTHTYLSNLEIIYWFSTIRLSMSWY